MYRKVYMNKEKKMKNVFFKIIKNNSYPLWHIQLYSNKGYFLSGLSGFKSLGYKSYEDAKKALNKYLKKVAQ